MKMQLGIVPWFSEVQDCFYIVDQSVPEGEQPAVLKTCDTRDQAEQSLKQMQYSALVLLRRYPNIVAPIICDSLGYATPTHAAMILGNAIQRKPDYCEWIDACYRGDPFPMIQKAIKYRHSHHGFMASFKLARALVQEAIDNKREPLFASWF